MISGALLLPKSMESPHKIKRFYKHNLLSLLVTSEIWYFIMFWFIVFVNPDNTILETKGFLGTLGELVKTMLFTDQTTMGSMWYIPMILCVYTVIPIFSIALNHVQSSRFLLIPCGVLALVSMVIPNLNGFFALLNIEFRINPKLLASDIFSVYILYILAGYYISNNALKKLSTPTVFFGACGSFLCLCAYQLFAFSCEYTYIINYNSFGLLVCSGFMFECIRRKGDMLRFVKKAVAYLSKISLGIYFVHIVIMEGLKWSLNLSIRSHTAKFLFLELVSFGGSLIIIGLLSKVRILKRYLFMIKD